MPLNDFAWVSEEEKERLDWSLMDEKQEIGYIVEVDLEYPTRLHKAHSSFPLAPERLTINEEMLSPYAKS